MLKKSFFRAFLPAWKRANFLGEERESQRDALLTEFCKAKLANGFIAKNTPLSSSTAWGDCPKTPLRALRQIYGFDGCMGTGFDGVLFLAWGV